MPFVSQTAPGTGNPLSNAFIQTMLDNAAFLLSEIEDLQDKALVQRVKSIESTATITSVSMTDVTNLTINITTTGGRLRIYLVPSDTTNVSTIAVTAVGSVAQIRANVKALVGATSLAEILYTLTGDVASPSWEVEIPPGAFSWDYTPAAGTYTVKLQASVVTDVEMSFTRVMLVVEEWAT